MECGSYPAGGSDGVLPSCWMIVMRKWRSTSIELVCSRCQHEKLNKSSRGSYQEKIGGSRNPRHDRGKPGVPLRTTQKNAANIRIRIFFCREELQVPLRSPVI